MSLTWSSILFMSSGRINLNVAPSRVKKYGKHSWPLLITNTVEPRLTATSVIRSTCYYGHFFGAIRQNGHTFSCKPVDMAKFFGLLVTVLMGFHCAMYIVYCTDNLPCDSRRGNVKMSRGRGLGGREKGRGFSLSLSPTPLPPQKQKPYYEQENIWIVGRR